MFTQPEVMALAEKYGKTPAQIMLRFLTQQDVIVIPKSIQEERIKENFDIFDFTLTEDELEILKAADTATAKIGNPEQPEMVEIAMTW